MSSATISAGSLVTPDNLFQIRGQDGTVTWGTSEDVKCGLETYGCKEVRGERSVPTGLYIIFSSHFVLNKLWYEMWNRGWLAMGVPF